jgi:predicted GTPase/type II secretory pathway pseudopilin PulG
MNTLQVLLEKLPTYLHPEVQAIADNTLHAQNSLQVCLVGEFSTGKSSLINALLGEALLPTAREETTALPTFINYAPELQFELINTDGTNTAISQTQFAQYTVAAPDNALCSLLRYPAEWLTGLTLIDLPGLGSQSQRHSDYTHAQISAADTIIYLLSPRGASQGDLNLLRLIKQYGKHLMIAVAQWDSIEQSVQEGEQAPDLIEWQAKIAQETGVDLELIGVSKYGHRRDTVINFLQDTKQRVQSIREQRFYAELEPLLNNCLGALKSEQTVCAASGAEETQALHTELLNQRQTLLGIKSDLYERSNQDQNQLEQHAEQITSQHRTQLTTVLNDLSPAVQMDDWQVFTESAYQHLKSQVLATTDDLKALSGHYGQLNLPDVDIQQFNLRLPPPAVIELDNFLDSSRLSVLQAELEQKQQSADSELAKINGLPVVNVENTLQQISELRAERNAIAQQELPRITQTMAGSEDAAQLGKNIGHALDIGFIVFEGPLVIAKALSMLGKTAKTAKAIHIMGKVSQVVSEPSLGFLEKLSFSYWGEQLGRRFDQPTQNLDIIDPQAEAEQRKLLQENEKQIAAQRAELHRLEDLQQQRDYSSWALEQNKKEQQRLNANIQALQERAKAAQREAEAEAIRQQQALLDNYRQQIIKQSLVNFDQQTRPMVDLLRTTCKRYWQEQVESTLAQRLQTIDTLNQQLQQAPEQKQATLATLQQQSEQVQAVLNSLKGKAYVA